ncbi:MAG: hypothetical protein MUE44_09030 [Oscillatoriaceae cyanobacterium Prado104]|jgi:hypothetical protein|nr:hypothetical protein [Oscillatoriaceae cyanobacterium Prado104]
MLSLYASQLFSVTDGKITRQYTFYKDDKDPNLFYVLPNNPSFVMDNGKPRFRFIKYRGDVSDAKGGFCVFSVSLDYSELENPALKTQAVKKLLSPDSPIVIAMKQRAENTLAMCVAANNNDQVNYEALRKKLGYSPKEADALVQDYKNGTKTTAKDFELLPDENSVKFSPVTFASSQAELNLQQMNNTLVEKVINPASPNLQGDHSTVFTVELSTQGATLFEQVMKEGQAGTVVVTYSPNFEARLPPATVTVTYKSTNTAKFTRDVTRDTWGSQDKIDKTQEDFFKENSAVTVEMGSIIDKTTKDEIAKLRTGLEEWGNKQLQDILNSKLTLDTTTLTEGQDKVDHFSNQLSAINDFTRVWSESSSIVFAMTLPMQLPTIKSILAPGDSLDNYFQEINTQDPFFQNQEVQVSANTDYDSLGIFSCEVKLYYGPGMARIKQEIADNKIKKDESGALQAFDPTQYDLVVKEIAFNKDSKVISDKIAWPKAKDSAGKGINTYLYSYQVNYKGSTIHYQSPCYYTDDPVLTLAVVDEVLQVEADGRNLVNWDIVQSVRFDIEYEDEAQKVSPQRYFYQLNANDAVAFEPKPIGAKRLQHVKYKSTFYLKTGQTIILPQTGLTSVNQTGKILIPVDDPFSGMNTYTFMPKISGIVDFIGITANYAIATTALNFQMTKDFTFSKEEDQSWNVPVVLDASGANVGHLTYSGKMRDQGQMKDISGDDGKSNFVPVGPASIRVVQFNPTDIDFTKCNAVSLNVKYKDQTGSYDFTSATNPVYKFSAVLDKPSDKFQYRLRLRKKDGTTIYIPGQTTNDWTETEATEVKLFLEVNDNLKPPVERIIQFNPTKIDFTKCDAVSLYVKYKDQTGSYDFTSATDPVYKFSAVLDKPSDKFQYRLELIKKDGTTTYIPGQTTNDWTETEKPTVLLFPDVNRKLS